MKRHIRKVKQEMILVLICTALLSCGTMLGGIVVVGGIICRNTYGGVKETDSENYSESVENSAEAESLMTTEYREIDEYGWNLLLVNPWNEIPDDFSVELTQLVNGHAIDNRAYPDLQDMMDDMRAEGLSPLICSSYRTDEMQRILFAKQVDKFLEKGYSPKDAETEAEKWVAVPGTSEHQIGLAVDIVDMNYQRLDKGQEDTAVQKWLIDNSHKYGFILRYPSDKSEITGINYEPWHYRYVGKEAAEEIYERGICLEEYLEGLK